MEIITIASLKGGVGKTQFTFNMASYLALEKNKRVLCIDLDPQGNLSQCLLSDNIKNQNGVKNLFIKYNELNKLKNSIQNSNINKIDLIGNSILNWELNNNLLNQTNREKILALNLKNGFFQYLETKYDYLLIDTNPTFSTTNINGYLVANNIILISDDSKFSLQGISAFWNGWERFCKELEINNNINSLILNRVNSFNLSSSLINSIKNNKIFSKLLLNGNMKQKEALEENRALQERGLLNK